VEKILVLDQPLEIISAPAGAYVPMKIPNVHLNVILAEMEPVTQNVEKTLQPVLRIVGTRN